MPQVRFVVDAGYVKQKAYDPERGMESLVVVPSSKVRESFMCMYTMWERCSNVYVLHFFPESNVFICFWHLCLLCPIFAQIASLQRAGRAGRTGPGQCYRLYSSECFDNMMDETVPEIRRINLANTVLYLKTLGIHDILGFDFLDPPSEQQIMEVR